MIIWVYATLLQQKNTYQLSFHNNPEDMAKYSQGTSEGPRRQNWSLTRVGGGWPVVVVVRMARAPSRILEVNRFPLSVCLDLSQNILSRNTQPSHPIPLKMHKL